MAEKQTFKVRVRQYADGTTWSMSHHDIDEHGVDFDSIVSGVEDGTPFREFDIEITARPPDPEQPAAQVEVPDDVAATTPPDPALSVQAVPA